MSAFVALVFAACVVCVQAQILAPDINFWTSQVPTSTFPARYDFTAVIDKFDRIFVIAGSEKSGPSNDVWWTGDTGTTWTCSTCNALNATRFSPRYYAGTAAIGNSMLGIAGGYSINGNLAFNDVWMSTDQGTHWSFIGNAAWPQQSGPVLLADSAQHIWVIESIGTAAPNLWQARQGDGWKTWTERGPIAIDGANRMGFGTVINKEDQLYLAGGHTTVQQYNDVWVADLTTQTLSIVWQQLTASAPWSPRTPTMNFDSHGNLYLFGQFALPGNQVPDLLWYSPVSAGAALTGTVWIRVDNATCNGVWPYSIIPDPADFTTLVDSADRMVIISAGKDNNANPSGNDSTVFIQLDANSATDSANLAANFIPSSRCWQPTPTPEPPGPGGLSGGAIAAIVIILLMVVGGAAGGYWWWKRRQYTDPRTGATETYNTLQ